jgi:hypothetical protein
MFALASISLLAHVGSVRGESSLMDDGSALVGNWVGESICAGANTSCHDEQVIYRIKQPPDSAGNVEIVADKIVDGKPVNMGVIRCKYDGEKKTLTGDLESSRYKGVWEFSVRSDTIEGTLTLLPEKTVARRIKVKKEAAQSRASAASD